MKLTRSNKQPSIPYMRLVTIFLVILSRACGNALYQWRESSTLYPLKDDIFHLPLSNHRNYVMRRGRGENVDGIESFHGLFDEMTQNADDSSFICHRDENYPVEMENNFYD